MEHSWVEGRCQYCGASKKIFDRGEGLETHAYAFIHTDEIQARVAELFGGEMQFDVIVGNPPYQMTGAAGGSSDSSIYHLFVEQALNLDPQFLTMVIPSRWLAGGRGMDDFRKMMLTGQHISHFVDYTKMSTAFPGVDFEGGVGYFLWDKNHHGDCKYTLFQAEEPHPTVIRNLAAHDIFVRDERALAVLEKVRALDEPTMEQLISSDTPFGLATNFSDWNAQPFRGSVAVYLTDRGKRTIGYVPQSDIRKNVKLIEGWKVLIPEAYGERGAIPALVLGPPIVAPPKSVCTQTYLVAGPFGGQPAAESFRSYFATRLFLFIV
jgi:site-specific DNA-methyltransferase (adenine-specific)